jgi:hypothetical protein
VLKGKKETGRVMQVVPGAASTTSLMVLQGQGSHLRIGTLQRRCAN